MSDIDVECVCESCDDTIQGWYVLISADGSRIGSGTARSFSTPEGYGGEMLGIADAIDAEISVEYERCAVRVGQGRAIFWSPRNNEIESGGVVSLACAKRLAEQIRETVKPRGVR